MHRILMPNRKKFAKILYTSLQAKTFPLSVTCIDCEKMSGNFNKPFRY